MQVITTGRYPKKGQLINGKKVKMVLMAAHTGYAFVLAGNEVLLVRAIDETIYVGSGENPYYVMELSTPPEVGERYKTTRSCIIGPMENQRVTTGVIEKTVEVWPGLLWYAESRNSAYYVVLR